MTETPVFPSWTVYPESCFHRNTGRCFALSRIPSSFVDFAERVAIPSWEQGLLAADEKTFSTFQENVTQLFALFGLVPVDPSRDFLRPLDGLIADRFHLSSSAPALEELESKGTIQVLADKYRSVIVIANPASGSQPHLLHIRGSAPTGELIIVAYSPTAAKLFLPTDFHLPFPEVEYERSRSLQAQTVQLFEYELVNGHWCPRPNLPGFLAVCQDLLDSDSVSFKDPQKLVSRAL